MTDLMQALKDSLRYQSMCPHCGNRWHKVYELTPDHYDVYESLSKRCPGSRQIPRHPYADMRDLWNGLPSPARLDVPS